MKYFALLCFFVGTVTAADTVQFNRDIRPILSDRCFHCHGPDEHERKADLRLDQADSAYAELDSGERAIVPGDVDASELMVRVATRDESLRMPPDDAPLAEAEIARLRQWIADGANYQGHWAYQPVSEPEPPPSQERDWIRNPIDQYVLDLLKRKEWSSGRWVHNLPLYQTYRNLQSGKFGRGVPIPRI